MIDVRVYRRLVAFALLLPVLQACGDGGGDASAEAPAADAPAPAAAASSPVFDESLEDDECALMTREDVSAATGIPAESIERPYDSVCLYRWEAGAGYPEGNLNLQDVTVHETVERARQHHGTFTQDVTAEEIVEAKAETRQELEARREGGEMTGAEEAAASVLVDAMPEGDVTHRRWSGIGEEAVHDGAGTLRILHGNATIWITGKTEARDWIDPDVATEIGRIIVSNMNRMAG